MVQEKLTIRNKSGLHMRPATELVALCSKLKSDIKITGGTKEINPKSILMLMGAGLTAGKEITIICEGPTEAEDLKQIVDLIKGGFGEELVC